MVILGIDPGSVIVGFSVLERDTKSKSNIRVIDFGCVIAQPGFSTGEKLEEIHNAVARLIKKHKPDVMSIENVFFFKNLKTVMPVSQTKGVILLAAQQQHISVMEFTPLQVKMAIAGYGRAEKKQVQKMIEQTLDLSHLDIKKNFRKKDDAYDAIAIALCAAIKQY
jgi:crossover junction endodeoxyribonuclease RuvC